MSKLRAAIPILSVASAIACAPTARADIGYQLLTTFALPAGAYDTLPDGRLLAIDGLGAVSMQTSLNSSTYTPVGSVGQINADAFWPTFVSVSPDASRIAVGNNEFNASNAVLLFDLAEALAGSAQPLASIASPSFAAAWGDNDTLYVSGAESTTFATGVYRLDVSAETATPVIAPAGAFSGGVAARAGSLYAGEGDTGEVFAFDLATLADATSAIAIDSGTPVAAHSSANSIDFDVFGNLILAGGVFDFGTGAISGSAVVIDPVTQQRQELAPAGTGTFYGAYFNHATNQLVVTADGTAYVYAVPAPASALALALLALPRRSRRNRA